LALAQRKIDCSFAIEMARLETALIGDGVNRDEIDAMLNYWRAEFAEWLSEYLAELREWLAECDRRLH
jgi:hypothetical protein